MIASKVKGREGQGDSDKDGGWRERKRVRESERAMGGDKGKEVGRQRGERENKSVGKRDMELEGEREGGKKYGIGR